MRVFAIGDLHLPGSQGKPMDVFGAHWERHFEKICEDWRARVLPEDSRGGEACGCRPHRLPTFVPAQSRPKRYHNKDGTYRMLSYLQSLS